MNNELVTIMGMMFNRWALLNHRIILNRTPSDEPVFVDEHKTIGENCYKVFVDDEKNIHLTKWCCSTNDFEDIEPFKLSDITNIANRDDGTLIELKNMVRFVIQTTIRVDI